MSEQQDVAIRVPVTLARRIDEQAANELRTRQRETQRLIEEALERRATREDAS